MWSTRPWLSEEGRFARVKAALEDTDADLIFADEPGLLIAEAFFRIVNRTKATLCAITIQLRYERLTLVDPHWVAVLRVS